MSRKTKQIQTKSKQKEIFEISKELIKSKNLSFGMNVSKYKLDKD